jgi:starch synthase
MVASEAVPYAKTGGLGDVITPMAQALARRGVTISLLLPAYPSALRQAGQARELALLPDLPGGPGRLLSLEDGGVTVILLQTARFDGRESPYVDDDGNEYSDNALRFADLAHAADRLCAGETPLEAPHVVHLHDWHTALVPLIQAARPGPATPSVLTIHNLAFQGGYPMAVAGELGVGDLDRIRSEGEFWGSFNFLKAGIRNARKLTTVSRSYAGEILTPQHGCGLHELLRERESDLVPIANGIDTERWSPAIDRLIPARFSVHDMRGKAQCKQALQAAFGLHPEARSQLLAIGSRLTHQKMADVALEALPPLLDEIPSLQLAVHGCGEHHYERGFMELAARYPGRVAAHIGYTEPMAHLLHAGADLLLHGSRFEPFGLTPIYSMRYGTVPIASRVGGMRDTIVDIGDAAVPNARGTGVLFEGESAQDMVQAVQQALDVLGHPQLKRLLQRNGMGKDFSWDGLAGSYLDLYREIVPASQQGLFVGARQEQARAEPEELHSPLTLHATGTCDSDARVEHELPARRSLKLAET